MARNGRNPKSPAYQWYPADAAIDEAYRLLDDAERGNFHTLYDFAWMNDGIPADLESIAALLGREVEVMRKRWLRLGRCWKPHPSRPDRLVNERQERERTSQTEYRERQRGNGLLGGRPKATRNPLESQSEPNKNPNESSLSTIHSPQARALDARARDDGPNLRKRQIGMHPTLDTPEVNAALDRWETHLREGGKHPKTPSSWDACFVRWERWGPARIVRAVEHTIAAGKFTVFEPEFEDRVVPVVPVAGPPQPPDAQDVFDRWSVRQSRLVRDGKLKAVPKYPGIDQARAELERKG